MKKFTILSLLTVLIFAITIVISGCTKEGPVGPAGADGENGINGQDGTAGCIECHNDNQTLFAMVNQWEHSTHATGGNYERNGTSCAPCHTSQGFLERMASGEQTTAEAINNPNPINCYTCHKIHETYTPDDWGFTYQEPVELWYSGNADPLYNLGKSNICANCHQARIVSPIPVVGGGNLEITNKRYGMHHGPVANMFVGVGGGGYEVGSGYSNSQHSNLVENGCVTCHMATAFGSQSGSHTFNVAYEYHGAMEINDAGCVACHTEGVEAIVEERQAETNALLEQLNQTLIDQGVLGEDGYVIVPADLTADQAGAVINYKFVLEDRSGGVHNPTYSKKLLENTIAALTTK